MSRVTSILLLAGMLSPSATVDAQIEPGHFVVLSRHAAPPRSRLVVVDPISGRIRPLPRFPHDDLDPGGVEVDPLNDDVIVALHGAAGSAALLRLRFAGGALTAARELARPAAAVQGLLFGPRGDVYSASSVRLERHGRMGSAAATAASLRAASSLDALPPSGLSAYGFVAESVAGTPQVTMFELRSGQAVQGPALITGLTGRRITSVHDLPTGLFRQVLTDDHGDVHLLESFRSLRQIPVAPSWPAGGAVAAIGQGLDLLVLGGAPHPFLKHLAVFSGGSGSWTTIAGPLPGDPVDFAMARPAGAAIQFFGAPGPGGGGMGSAGFPVLGSSSFAVNIQQAAPNATAFLAVGADDMWLAGRPLPVRILGGGIVLTSSEVLLPNTTSSAGFATQTLPIPSDLTLLGARVFTQWLTMSGGTLASSEALALRIGR